MRASGVHLNPVQDRSEAINSFRTINREPKNFYGGTATLLTRNSFLHPSSAKANSQRLGFNQYEWFLRLFDNRYSV